MNHAIARDAASHLRESRPRSQQQRRDASLSGVIHDPVQVFNLPRFQHLEHFQRLDKTLRPFAGQMHLQGVGGVLDGSHSTAQCGQHFRRRTDRG